MGAAGYRSAPASTEARWQPPSLYRRRHLKMGTTHGTIHLNQIDYTRAISGCCPVTLRTRRAASETNASVQRKRAQVSGAFLVEAKPW